MPSNGGRMVVPRVDRTPLLGTMVPAYGNSLVSMEHRLKAGIEVFYAENVSQPNIGNAGALSTLP